MVICQEIDTQFLQGRVLAKPIPVIISSPSRSPNSSLLPLIGLHGSIPRIGDGSIEQSPPSPSTFVLWMRERAFDIFRGVA